MRASRPLWLILLVVVVTSFGAMAPAFASGGHAHLFEQLTPEQEEEVLHLLELAEEAYDDGQFRTALARFNEAYALFPHPDLLFRIGRCYEQLENYELAIQHYRHFLEEVPDARERGRIEQNISRLEERVGEQMSLVRIETFPIGASLYVDDPDTAPVGETPRDITLRPGNYVIIIKKEGYETERQTVHLERGEQLRYQLRLTEIESDADGSSRSRSGGASVDWWKPVVSVALVGVGGVALFQAAGHQTTHREYEAELDDLRGAEGTPDEQARRAYLREQSPVERSLAVTYGVVGGVSLLGAVAFTTWWMLSDRSTMASVGISPTRDGVSVGVFGRF